MARPATTTDAEEREKQSLSGATAPQGAFTEATSAVSYTNWTAEDDEGEYYGAAPDVWDVCVWGDTRHGADITIPFKLGEFGPVDEQGYPTDTNPMVGKLGRLDLMLWDVDDKATISPPELDFVFLGSANPALESYEVPLGLLTGTDNGRSTTSLSVPLDALKPKSDVNPTGINYVNVDVDIANNGAPEEQWCVAVNLAQLRLFTDPLPTVMIHGFTVTGEKMRPVRDRWVLHAPELADKISFTDYPKTGGMVDRLPTVRAEVDRLLEQSGHRKVNLVGHSFGGLTARLYLRVYPEKVANVVMLGTPNGGTQLADIGCDAMTFPLSIIDFPIYSQARAELFARGLALAREATRCMTCSKKLSKTGMQPLLTQAVSITSPLVGTRARMGASRRFSRRSLRRTFSRKRTTPGSRCGAPSGSALVRPRM